MDTHRWESGRAGQVGGREASVTSEHDVCTVKGEEESTESRWGEWWSRETVDMLSAKRIAAAGVFDECGL